MLETHDHSTAEQQVESIEFRLAQQSDFRRSVIGRCLVHGFPILAALFAAIYAGTLHRFAPPFWTPSATIVIIVNAALAALVSAAGVMFLTGKVWVRTLGAFAYAVLSLILYMATFGGLVYLYETFR